MPSAGVKIYIGNLPERARPEEIKECFTKYGNVVNMELKGTYGFIEYEERRMCDEAITQLHGTDFQGSQLRVEYAHAERSGGYKYREGKSTDTCFKCGQVGHWARECTSNGRDLSSHRKISSRYDDRRISDSYVREPYSARDGRDKYDRDERYLPPPPLDRSYDRPGYDRYAREPELDYRREYRSTYDRGYERERERAYDRAYPERDYERYPRDNYDRSYYPPPPRDGYERDGYERRALAPPDVTAYPARGRTGSPQPRRSSYERIRDAPLSSSYRRSPPPPSRYTDSLIGPPPLRPPPSPRASLYRRRSLSPMRSSRAPPPYSGRPRSPSPLGRALPARRGGPRTPTPPARR